MSCGLFAEVQKAVATEEVSELSEEDVAVSYIGDELDLKTVGDIIAIIEDKVGRQLRTNESICNGLGVKKKINP